MKVVAVDEQMLCLRYTPIENEDNASTSSTSSYGVPTTLVFEPLQLSSSSSDLEMGNCFDHFVIETSADINAVWEQTQTLLKETKLECPMFMKPTEMFGKVVFGVIDPNGYKVIFAGTPSGLS